MSLLDRITKKVIQEEREEFAKKSNPFVGQDWIDTVVRGLTEAEKKEIKEKVKKEKPEKPGKKPAKDDKGIDGKRGADLEKEIEKGKKEAPKKDDAKAPPKKEPKEPKEPKDAPAATEPAPDDPNTKAGDPPPEEKDDEPGGAADAPGASATEPVGPARTADDCERDHATCIGQADQHARAEQSSRAEADKHRKAVEQFADEYEDAGGQVSQVGGQRHLHPPSAEDSDEIHDIYQQFDDALWNRDEHELKAIEAHRKKREARGQARRHDYEKQTGEKWDGEDHPPGFGHHHVERKGGKDKGKDKKKEKPKPKTESLDEAINSLGI
jgi:hypothetical protein